MRDYSGMFVELCIYVRSSHTARVRIDRVRLPILPVRGQLAEQGKLILPCPRLRLRIWPRETGSAVSSGVSLLISILRLNLVLTYGIPPEFRGGVHLLSVHVCIMNAAVRICTYYVP